MNKFGLFVTNSNKHVGSGNLASSKWRVQQLRYDGEVIATVLNPDNLGLRVNSNKLNLGGVNIAKSNNSSPKIKSSNKEVKFGDDVLLSGIKCINITLSNFNKLLKGIDVDGYSKYNPSACYNIVSNVATAEEVEWEPTEYDLNDPIFCKHYHIYNNIVGMDDVYEEYLGPIDDTHRVNTFVAISTRNQSTGAIIDAGCPKLGFHYFNNVIKPDDMIHIQFHVDTHNMKFFEHSEIGRKFTIYVKDEQGRFLGRKTTYAGIIRMNLRLPNDVDFTSGYHWFSIQAVDDRGVGSVIQYYDFKVKSDDEIELDSLTEHGLSDSEFTDINTESLVYHVTPETLSKFGIVAGTNITQDQAYRNKLGFSLLFNAVKNSGYKGIRLQNEATYCITYKANRGIGQYANAGSEINSFTGVVDGVSKTTTNIFEDITLENVSTWSKTINGTTYNINDCPIDAGGVEYFLLHLYEDEEFFDSEGNLKSRYIRTYTRNGSGTYNQECSVVYDTVNEEFICIRRYELAPLIKGKPIRFIGNQDTDVEDELSYNKVSGFLRYYLKNIDKITHNEINLVNRFEDISSAKLYEKSLSYIVDETSADNDFKIDGESYTIPQNADLEEFIYKDTAKCYRDSEGRILSRWGSGTYVDDPYVSQVKWDLGDETPESVYVSDRYSPLQTKSFWAFIHNANNVSQITTKVKTVEEVDGNYITGQIALNPWQGIDWYIGGTHLRFPINYSENDYNKQGDKSFYIVANNSDWGTNGYEVRSYMKIPSDFIIDLNEATIVGTDTNDVSRYGSIFVLNGCKNTHIKNGNIEGGLANHNWIRQAFRAPSWSPLELFSTMYIANSKFCSFDNLNINGVLGYEAGDGVLTNYTYSCDYFGRRMTDIGYLGNTEENDSIILESFEDGLELEAILPSSSSTDISDTKRAKLENNTLVEEDISLKSPCVGLIHSADYTSIPHKTVNGQTVYSDDIIPIAIKNPSNNTPRDIDSNKCGKRSEVFLHFFDNTNTYISTVKTKWYHRVKVPANAVKFKATGYGVTIKEDGDRIISMSYTTDKVQVPQAFSQGYVFDFGNTYTNNIQFNNVKWSNTRTIGVQVNEGGNTSFVNCEFHNMSRLHGDWTANPYFMDFEEGQKVRGDISLINCHVKVDRQDNEESLYPYINVANTAGWRDSALHFLIYACKQFMVAKCSGFRVTEYGGVIGGCYLNSKLLAISTANSYYEANPGNIYVDTSFGNDSNPKSVYNKIGFPAGSGSNTENRITKKGTNTFSEPNRTNRDDDPVPDRIGLLGCFGRVSSNDITKYNIINGSLKYNGDTTVVEHISGVSHVIKMDTQSGELRSGLTGATAKYNGFPEKYQDGKIGDYSVQVNSENVNVVVYEDINVLRNRVKRVYHTILMLNITECVITDIKVDNNSTLQIFCYNAQGKLVTNGVVTSIAAIPSSTVYVKFQVRSNEDYEILPIITVTVNGTATLHKNSVPGTGIYVPFRFETRIPVTDEIVEECNLSYTNNTRCVDTGLIVMPSNYSMDGDPVPLIIYLHGTSGVNDFYQFNSNSENFLVPEFLSKFGYAVAECSGVTDLYYNAKAGFGAPSYLEAIKNLIKYIGENYNVDTNGIYVACKSAGGFMAGLLAVKDVLNIRAIGMLSPALSPTISVSNHAQRITETANMENDQLGINHTFIYDKFYEEDRDSVVNNVNKWRTIDGFFTGTDLLDEEVRTIVSNAFSYIRILSSGSTADATAGLSILADILDGTGDSYGKHLANKNLLAAKKRKLKVPVKIWISKADRNVWFINTRAYVEMCRRGNSVCILHAFEALDESHYTTTNPDEHNICTTKAGPNIRDYIEVIPGNENTRITTFNGKLGVPIALCELIEWFKMY